MPPSSAVTMISTALGPMSRGSGGDVAPGTIAILSPKLTRTAMVALGFADVAVIVVLVVFSDTTE